MIQDYKLPISPMIVSGSTNINVYVQIYILFMITTYCVPHKHIAISLSVLPKRRDIALHNCRVVGLMPANLCQRNNSINLILGSHHVSRVAKYTQDKKQDV